MKLNERAGRLIARSASEAKRLAAAARASARGRGARAKLRAAKRLEELASRCRKVADQIDRRVRGLKITDRLVSIADPDARPIRKGKLGKPTEFGYADQICEITENTRKGARGLILPAGHELGNPAENKLLPQTAAELDRAGIRPREIVADGGFMPGPTKDAFPDLTDEQIHLSGRHEPGSRRTRKRRARYRTGIEGRISHLNVATGCADPDSKQMTGCRSGPARRSSPTTSTPSPSEPAETLPQALPPGQPFTSLTRPRHPGAAVSVQAVYPGEVTRHPDLTLFSYEIFGLVGRQGAGPARPYGGWPGGPVLRVGGPEPALHRAEATGETGVLSSPKAPGKTRERTVCTLTEKGLTPYANTRVPRSPYPAQERIIAPPADLRPRATDRWLYAGLLQLHLELVDEVE
jgi:IS5 family transposase